MDIKKIKTIDLFIKNLKPKNTPTNLKQISFNYEDAQQWYNDFIQRLNKNKEYFPIYRIADGEFIFMVGLYPEIYLGNWFTIKWFVITIKKVIFFIYRFIDFQPRTCWGEKYNWRQKKKIRRKYGEYLKKISDKGALAIHFTFNDDHFGEQYFAPVLKFLNKKKIELNANNYFPFYFVYMFLCSSDAIKFFNKKNILIITSFDNIKKKKIEEVLYERYNVKKVNFIQISAYNSMLDKIVIKDEFLDTDIALIGAGIGAANILDQLSILKAVCIDAGYCIDVIAQIKKPNRIFTDYE